MIVFRCSKCGHRQDVDDKFAGKRVRCPECKEVMDLTSYAAAAPHYGAILTMARILEVLAILLLVTGLLLVPCLLLLMKAMASASGSNELDVTSLVGAAIVELLVTLLVSLSVLASAQVLRCIRDIARNSFSLPGLENRRS